MYNNESYEEYIRSILGYPNYSNNYFENGNYYPNNYRNINEENELEQYYPEIYKIVYPMISKECLNNTNPISEELIEEMTDKIYNSIEVDNEIQLNINLKNETNNRNVSNNVNTKKEVTNNTKIENRQIRNNNLRDLIKILLIRELLGNRPNRPNNRPPIFRPQFPDRPGQGLRPPMFP